MDKRDISYWILNIEETQGILRNVDGVSYSEIVERGLEEGALWYTANLARHAPVYLTVLENDILRLTDDGRRFLDNDEEIVSRIDEYEGVSFVLGVIAESGSCNFQDILSHYERFYELYVEDGLYDDTRPDETLPARLENLERRNFIRDSGQVYAATDEGLDYFRRWKDSATADSSLALLIEMKDVFRQRQLAKHLPKMHHKKFEELIKSLLRQMGYKHVRVVGRPGDGGIDVVADLEKGITRVRHVIQAKRQESKVGSGVVDKLRGSLHRGGAGLQTVGTIVTTGTFTKNAKDAAVEEGVAPITLVDGEALLDLLVRHGFFVSKGK